MAISNVNGTSANVFSIGLDATEVKLTANETNLVIDKPIKVNEENVITDVNTQELENKTIDATKNTIINLVNDLGETDKDIWSAIKVQSMIASIVAEAIGAIPVSSSTVKYVKFEVGTTSIIDTNIIPVDATILKVMVNINTAYVGTNVGIDIKVNGTTPIIIMANTGIEEPTVDLYIKDQFTTISVANTGVIEAVVSGSGITQGSASIIVEYIDNAITSSGYGN